MNMRTTGTRLYKNSLFNLVGLILPIIVAIPAIPLLISELGQQRFGFLTIVWLIVGYLGILDLGISRAITRDVSRRLSTEKINELPVVIWSGVAIVLTASFLVVTLLVYFAGDITKHFLKNDLTMYSELSVAVKIMAFSIPFVVLSSSFRGVLEAHQRFDLVNYVRIPIGFLNYGAPAFIALIYPRVDYVVGVIFCTRLLGFLSTLLMVGFVVKGFWNIPKFSKNESIALLKSGGLFTVINILNPILVISDRVFVGMMVPLSIVPYYTVPTEVISRLWILPNAVMMVLFPEFSKLWVRKKKQVLRVFVKSLKYIFIIMVIVCLSFSSLGPDILNIWMGKEFSYHSSVIFQCLILGVFLNSLSYPSFALLQGAGKANVLILIFTIEMIIYLPTLWLVISSFGLIGAAVISLVRNCLETLLFLLASIYLLEINKKLFAKNAILLIFAMVVIALPILMGETLRRIYGILMIPLTSVLIWKFAFTEAEKQLFLFKIKK